MGGTYLVVHSFSYRYITAAVDYIREQLEAYVPTGAQFFVCEDLDGADISDGSVVFVVGDPFGRFTRRPTCRYIFVNFSILERLGPAECYSPAARQWIDRKRAAFDGKVQWYDAVLDYDEEQAARLADALPIPVLSFHIGMREAVYSHQPAREFDVCITGTPTPRRVTLERRLSRKGHRLSPATGVVLEEVAARSRTVMNAHAYRSANVEFPRIVSALLSGAVLVTEENPRLSRFFPPGLFVVAEYGRIAARVEAVLADPAGSAAVSARAAEWMRTTYLPKCAAAWQHLFEALV